jgi:hypothetical protein
MEVFDAVPLVGHVDIANNLVGPNSSPKLDQFITNGAIG